MAGFFPPPLFVKWKKCGSLLCFRIPQKPFFFFDTIFCIFSGLKFLLSLLFQHGVLESEVSRIHFFFSPFISVHNSG